MSLFVLNGYEDLEAFCEIREKDLDYLGITDPQNRAKILAAVQVLNEYECKKAYIFNKFTLLFFNIIKELIFILCYGYIL